MPGHDFPFVHVEVLMVDFLIILMPFAGQHDHITRLGVIMA